MDELLINFEYFMCPNKVFDLDLSTKDKIVYIYLHRCANKYNDRLSYEVISEKTGISVVAARESIKNLVDMKLISEPVIE